MSAAQAIWNSEKGILAVALILGVTALAVLGRVSFAEWREYTTWIFGLYVGGKTVQGAAHVIASRANGVKKRDG